MMQRLPLLRANLLGLGLAVGLFAATGCARHRGATTNVSPQATAATPPPVREAPRAQSLEDDADLEEEAGLLVVSGDIVQRCETMQVVRAHAPMLEGEAPVWLFVLKSLADCMTEGDLRGKQVIVRGEETPRTVVRYVLARLGVDARRVREAEPVSDPGCIAGPCAEARRVEIALSDAEVPDAGRFAFRVARPEVVSVLHEID
jgi:hypothetical protein